MERGLLKAVGLVSFNFYSSSLMAWVLGIQCLFVGCVSFPFDGFWQFH